MGLSHFIYFYIHWIFKYCFYLKYIGFPGGSEGKESACHAEDPGSIPGSGRSLGKENGYPLQYSCLDNSMDRRAWQATVHGIAKSCTWLSSSLTNTTYQSLGLKVPLEEGMATHSSILAWRIPGTEEPPGLQSIGSQRVGQTEAANNFTSL